MFLSPLCWIFESGELSSIRHLPKQCNRTEYRWSNDGSVDLADAMEFVLKSSLFFVTANIKFDFQPDDQKQRHKDRRYCGWPIRDIMGRQAQSEKAQAKATKPLIDTGMMPVDHAIASVKFSELPEVAASRRWLWRQPVQQTASVALSVASIHVDSGDPTSPLRVKKWGIAPPRKSASLPQSSVSSEPFRPRKRMLLIISGRLPCRTSSR
jgi:hypothetical protein